jgi:hypothetical protein
MLVKEDEFIHADRHGAIVIPEKVIPHLESAISTVIENENIILAPARDPNFTLEKLEAAWAEFESART